MTADRLDPAASARRLAARFGPTAPADEPRAVPEALTPAEARERALAAQRQAVRQARRAAWHRLVPIEFADARVSDFDPEVRDRLAAWPWYDGVSLLLVGPVGTGKTRAGWAAARAAFGHGQAVRFWPVVELVKALSYDNPDHLAVFEQACSVGVLFLDDLGVGDESDWALGQLYGIVNRRWMSDLPIIATTNLAPAALESKLGERIYSRLAPADAMAIRMSGDDRRRAK